jgi:uncharacterized RDD family membrane protein YckC
MHHDSESEVKSNDSNGSNGLGTLEPSAGSPPGYRSKDARISLIIAVIVLAVVYLAGVDMVPRVVRLVLGENVVSAKIKTLMGGCEPLAAVELTAHQMNNSAVWDNCVWYVQTQAGVEDLVKTRLICLPFGGAEPPREAASLDIVEPWLLGGADRLWILSSDKLGWFKDGKFEITTQSKEFNEPTRPFLYQGKPAIIEQKWPGHCLKVFEEGRWRELACFTLDKIKDGTKFSGERLQAFECDGKVFLFCHPSQATNVLYCSFVPQDGKHKLDQWSEVAEVGQFTQWKAVPLGGRPAFFYHASIRDEPHVRGIRLAENEWKEFFTYPVSWDIGLGICPTRNEGDNFVLLRRVLPLGSEVVGVENGGLAWHYEQDGKVGLSKKTFMLGKVLDGVKWLLSGILAIVYTFLMVQFRVTEYSGGEVPVRFASLTRRGIACAVDSLIIFGPFAVFVSLTMGNLMQESFSIVNLISAGWRLGCSAALWFPVIFIFYSLLEGYWGRTPGKCLTGIRVVDYELKPCGFIRALVRQLVRLIDSMSGYLVGMMTAALTQKWQRLGDLAASTIVIYDPVRKTNHPNKEID